MKNFSSSAFRLASASFETRLIYSLFLFFVTIGLLTTGIFQFQRVGFGYEQIVNFYLGGELNGQMSFGRNFPVLLEETHFHAFIMGITFLILSHLFIGTSIRKGTKLFFIFLAFVSSLFDMGGGWLIRYLSPGFAYLILASWTGLWISYLGMILIPLYEMWRWPGLDFK
ncbi:MAG: hypothetical protein ACE5HC_13490 [Candidatus Binatia bacterium]